MGEPLLAAIGRSVLDDDVLSLDVPEFPQPLSEGIEVGSVHRRGRCLQHTDPIHLPRRLGLGGERRGEESTSQSAEERSPVYHSIT